MPIPGKVESWARVIVLVSFAQLCCGLAHCYFPSQGLSWLSSGVVAVANTLTASIVVGYTISPHMFCLFPIFVFANAPTVVLLFATSPDLAVFGTGLLSTCVLIVAIVAFLLRFNTLYRNDITLPLPGFKVSFLLIVFVMGLSIAHLVIQASVCQPCPDCYANPDVLISESGACESRTNQPNACVCYSSCVIDGCHNGCDGLSSQCYYFDGNKYWVASIIIVLLGAVNAFAFARHQYLVKHPLYQDL